MLKLYLPPVNSVYKLWYFRPKITKNLAEYLTGFPPVIEHPVNSISEEGFRHVLIFFLCCRDIFVFKHHLFEE